MLLCVINKCLTNAWKNVNKARENERKCRKTFYLLKEKVKASLHMQCQNQSHMAREKLGGTYSYARFLFLLWFVSKMQLNYMEHYIRH